MINTAFGFVGMVVGTVIALIAVFILVPMFIYVCVRMFVLAKNDGRWPHIKKLKEEFEKGEVNGDKEKE